MDGERDDALSFTEDDRDCLVLIVKNAHQLGWKGSKGTWTEFMAERCSPWDGIDPERQRWFILADFVKTFENADLVKSLRRWRKWRSSNILAESSDPWPQTPEQCLVERTYRNPYFYTAYHFPSFLPGWKRTKRGSSSDASEPERLLSLDCEMVLCEGNEQQVVQVCIVDRNSETVLDTLVKPSKKVIDYISHIHGITKDDLKKAAYTQEEIQKKVFKLLKPGTILVGHSVFNDLKALKIDHQRIIDTSMLFERRGSGFISLDRLCKSALGYDLRENGLHKCIDDAIVPLKIVLRELENKPDRKSKLMIWNGDPCRLLIHKLSHPLSREELKSIVSATVPCTIESVFGKKGQLHAIFETKELANKAFQLLPGEVAQDICGFEQKSVSQWRNGLFLQLRVRKTAHSEDLTPQSTKRDQDRDVVEAARLKRSKQMPEAEQEFSINTCSCAGEIERLKKSLDAVNTEIAALKETLQSQRH